MNLDNVSAEHSAPRVPRRETLKEFHARMRRIAGVADAASNGRRVGSWIKFHCGDRVFDESDPRWIGRVEAIQNGVIARVTWDDTEWHSFVPLEKAKKGTIK